MLFNKVDNVFLLESDRSSLLLHTITRTAPPDTGKLAPVCHPVNQCQATPENLLNVLCGKQFHLISFQPFPDHDLHFLNVYVGQWLSTVIVCQYPGALFNLFGKSRFINQKFGVFQVLFHCLTLGGCKFNQPQAWNFTVSIRQFSCYLTDFLTYIRPMFKRFV